MAGLLCIVKDRPTLMIREVAWRSTEMCHRRGARGLMFYETAEPAPSLKVSESNSQNVRWQDPESKRAEDHNG